MKKVIAFALAAMSFLSANAGNQRATGMTMVDGFKLGVGIGAPGWSNNGDHRAVMPMLTVDGAVGLASGFINTSKFGNNGGIDLGFQYGICGYNDLWWERHAPAGMNVNCGLMEHLIVVRSAFHFQFLKKLDTYMGFDGGVALSIPTGDDYYDPCANHHAYRKDAWENHVNGVFGMYAGGTWYFNDAIGAGIEWEGDWLDHATPGISAKFQFRF